MAFAGDQNDLVFLGQFKRAADRFLAVHTDFIILFCKSGDDLINDRLRVFTAGIVAGDDGMIRQVRRPPAPF